ncbi:MAG: VWA domain-containing protein [Nitrospirota bacterium]|nr:MAG: VWA domain-containing protein [Nitrospirota bacterium]
MDSSLQQPHPLQAVLADRLDQATTENLVASLTDKGLADQLYDLLLELQDLSSKIASEAVWALPDFVHRCGFETVVAWLDLGIGLTQSSGALGLRYFKESPLILGVMDHQDHRAQLLALALELTDGQFQVAPNCAFEFFKKAPELLLEVPINEIGFWAEIGMELSRWDYVLGKEFFLESPSIAKVLGKDQVRDWISFGMKLVTQNNLGKPDYVGTLEFFRTSPALLNEIPEPEVRPWVVSLGSVLAGHSPQQAITFLAQAPSLLGMLPSGEWRLKVLKYGLLVADRDAEVALAYLRRAPEVLQIGGEADETLRIFDNWFQGGMEVLEYSSEGGQAYFSLQTKNALASLEQAMCGVPLRQVARSLKLFAQGMCGTDVSIESLPEAAEDPGSGSIPDLGQQSLKKASVSPDGKRIFLPVIMRHGGSREENIRWYTVMTAHEAGHLEFGTYQVAFDRLQPLVREVHARYSTDDPITIRIEIQNLGELFRLYPQPGVIRDLWEILEDARVDFKLQQEYPGLRVELVQLTKESVKTRSFLHGMTAREMVMDSLLLNFAGEFTRKAPGTPLEDIVSRMWELSKTILDPLSTAEDAIQLADRLYQVLDAMIGSLGGSDQNGGNEAETNESSDLGPGPAAAEEVASQYRPITNWSYRGTMNPEYVQGSMNPDDTSSGEYPRDWHNDPEKPPHAGQEPAREGGPQDLTGREETAERQEEFGQSPMEQWLQLEYTHRNHQQFSHKGPQEVYYDEWDGEIQDYRPRWCRVLEREGVEGSPDFVDQTLVAYGPSVRLLRRYFETIRPTALRRVGRQDDGEDFDLDAIVQRVIDRRSRHEPSDRIYIRREKRERQVAVAFLLDMSGSTGRQIGSGQRRVIDIEKEGLILLSEALAAVGDQYALYGYSGQGRGHIDIVKLKDFQESSLNRAALRIGAVTPLQQNRDGAAIRHVVYRLRQQTARTRLLVLLSDGRPLDDGYGDEYSLEDTKMALREARQQEVHPFCITVDHAANDYLKRMYGEVGFVVIDNVDALPTRLPGIYQRLTS